MTYVYGRGHVNNVIRLVWEILNQVLSMLKIWNRTYDGPVRVQHVSEVQHKLCWTSDSFESFSSRGDKLAFCENGVWTALNCSRQNFLRISFPYEVWVTWFPSGERVMFKRRKLFSSPYNLISYVALNVSFTRFRRFFSFIENDMSSTNMSGMMKEFLRRGKYNIWLHVDTFNLHVSKSLWMTLP